MTITTALILNSVLLGVGLAMDAFSVSLANGLNEHRMGLGRMLAIAGTFAGFQFVMPMIGWICVHAAAQKFEAFQKYIPWIALLLLLYIGGKMLIEGIQDARENKAEEFASGAVEENKDVTVAAIGDSEVADGDFEAAVGDSGVATAEARAVESEIKRLGLGALMVQGVATSIDALSVGFTIAEYNTLTALVSTIIIGVVTYIICMAGLSLGKRFGTKLAGKASILGGVILIGIGIEIFVSGVFL